MNRRLSLLTLKIVALVVFIFTQYPPLATCEVIGYACVPRNHTRYIISTAAVFFMQDQIKFERLVVDKQGIRRVRQTFETTTQIQEWIESNHYSVKVISLGAILAAAAGLLASFLMHTFLKLIGKN